MEGGGKAIPTSTFREICQETFARLGKSLLEGRKDYVVPYPGVAHNWLVLSCSK